MAVLTFEQIIKELSRKIYRPIYFLMGKEPYFIDKISDYIEENVLDEMSKDFNLHILYGKDISVNDIIGVSRGFPMMSDYTVVIVKEAQNIKNLDELLPYVMNPMSSTILVINYKGGNYDKRKKIIKEIANNYVLFESPEIKEYKVGKFIENYVKTKGFEIEEKATVMLVEFLGNNITQIVNELDKLMILMGEERHIIPDLVEKNIGISKDYNIFELIKAIGSKDYTKAQFIAYQFGKNPKKHPFVVVTQMIYQFFVKLLIVHHLKQKKYSSKQIASEIGLSSTYFFKEYELAASKYPIPKIIRNIDILHKYDLKSKGVDVAEIDEKEFLKELIFFLMN